MLQDFAQGSVWQLENTFFLHKQYNHNTLQKQDTVLKLVTKHLKDLFTLQPLQLRIKKSKKIKRLIQKIVDYCTCEVR